MTTTTTRIDHIADMGALRPLIASAWKEGELSDLALSAVCLEIIRDPSLDLSCRETLQQWLDSSEGQKALRTHSTRDRFASAS
jgi:hypothetical protein